MPRVLLLLALLGLTNGVAVAQAPASASAEECGPTPGATFRVPTSLDPAPAPRVSPELVRALAASREAAGAFRLSLSPPARITGTARTRWGRARLAEAVQEAAAARAQLRACGAQSEPTLDRRRVALVEALDALTAAAAPVARASSFDPRPLRTPTATLTARVEALATAIDAE